VQNRLIELAVYAEKRPNAPNFVIKEINDVDTTAGRIRNTIAGLGTIGTLAQMQSALK
jgi:hypothetical protein